MPFTRELGADLVHAHRSWGMSGTGRARARRAMLCLAGAALVILVSAPAAVSKKAHHHHHHHHHASAHWSWSASAIPGSQAQVQALSCPSASLCFASGPVGIDSASGGTNNVFWTTTPGSGTWQTAPLENAVQPSLSAGPEPIQELSCPDTSFCMVADGFANFWYTGDPTGGAGAWQQDQSPTGAALIGLTCQTGGVCDAIDVEGHAISLTNDTVNDITPAFNLPEGGSAASVSCPATQFCAAVADTTQLAWTSDAVHGSWQTGTIAGASDLGQVDCPSAGLCLLAGARLYVSTDPSAGAASFKPVKGVASGDISCASASFCAIAVRSGIEVSTSPASGKWTKVKTPFTPGLISCPQADVCAATDNKGVELGRG